MKQTSVSIIHGSRGHWAPTETGTKTTSEHTSSDALSLLDASVVSALAAQLKNDSCLATTAGSIFGFIP